ncbi:MAG TPA: hypothetical protein EYN66_12475, partial [Myxococcales bacterium]|nr:hypothetical protein [Myxococcales bacterium]
MADHVQDHYRGLILRDDRFSAVNATLSPATQQAGPMVGEPTVTAGHGYMDLEATGTSGAELDYQVRCVKPGNAKGTTTGGRFSWKNKADPDTSWRDWHPYSFVTSSDVWAVTEPNKANSLWPHAITSKDGFVHVVYATDDTVGLSSGIFVRTLDPSTDAWTTVDLGVQVIDPTVTPAKPVTIIELPTGRLLVMMGVTLGSISVFYSDDRGTTWISSQAQSFIDPLSYGIVVPDTPAGAGSSTVHYQAVYHNGYITLVRETLNQNAGGFHEVDHYVSEDFGVSWRLIERFQPDYAAPIGVGTSVESVYNPCLVVDELGGVMMIYSTSAF